MASHRLLNLKWRWCVQHTLHLVRNAYDWNLKLKKVHWVWYVLVFEKHFIIYSLYIPAFIAWKNHSWSQKPQSQILVQKLLIKMYKWLILILWWYSKTLHHITVMIQMMMINCMSSAVSEHFFHTKNEIHTWQHRTTLNLFWLKNCSQNLFVRHQCI